jgi:ribonucleoside-diphosphate reductase alpha chain
MFSLLDINNEVPSELIIELNKFLTKTEVDDTIKQVMETGRCGNIQKIPEHIKSIFSIGSELDYKLHIDMADAIQKHNDDAISKTINISNDFTKDDLYDLIIYAYKSNLKGITVFCEHKNLDKKGEFCL